VRKAAGSTPARLIAPIVQLGQGHGVFVFIRKLGVLHDCKAVNEGIPEPGFKSQWEHHRRGVATSGCKSRIQQVHRNAGVPERSKGHGSEPCSLEPFYGPIGAKSVHGKP
jgi:hypothetical protein